MYLMWSDMLKVKATFMSTTITIAYHVLVEENFDWCDTSWCQVPPWSYHHNYTIHITRSTILLLLIPEAIWSVAVFNRLTIVLTSSGLNTAALRDFSCLAEIHNFPSYKILSPTCTKPCSYTKCLLQNPLSQFKTYKHKQVANDK